MRIYVDFDDVLCETAQGLSVLVRAMFGRVVPFEQIHTFDLQVAFALDRQQYLALMDRAHEPQFLLGLPDLPGCVDCLRAWRTRGHEVVVVTGRPATTHEPTTEWLGRKGIGAIPVLYVDKYNRRPVELPGAPPTLSLDALQREHFDLMIDDSPMVLDVLLARPAGRTIVFDRPWNRTYDCTGGRVTRCKGWREVAMAMLPGVEK